MMLTSQRDRFLKEILDFWENKYDFKQGNSNDAPTLVDIFTKVSQLKQQSDTIAIAVFSLQGRELRKRGWNNLIGF